MTIQTVELKIDKLLRLEYEREKSAASERYGNRNRETYFVEAPKPFEFISFEDWLSE